MTITDRRSPLRTPALTRREALWRLGAVLAGAAAAGCTPLRIALKAYPEDFTPDGDLVERTLRAFVLTIVPGAPADDPNLTRVFADRFHPFGPYRAFFASDLCRRAIERFGAPFDGLDPVRRTTVVQRGLQGDATTRRLYAGAILLAQIAVYAGIYDDTRGSPLIDFEGRQRFRGFDALTYPDPERFLAAAQTADGNFA